MSKFHCEILVDTIIGIHDHELKKNQPIIIDVSIKTNSKETLEKLRVTELVLGAIQKVSLLEKQAYLVLDALKKNVSCQQITVTIKKPWALKKAHYAFFGLEDRGHFESTI